MQTHTQYTEHTHTPTHTLGPHTHTQRDPPTHTHKHTGAHPTQTYTCSLTHLGPPSWTHTHPHCAGTYTRTKQKTPSWRSSRKPFKNRNIKTTGAIAVYFAAKKVQFGGAQALCDQTFESVSFRTRCSFLRTKQLGASPAELSFRHNDSPHTHTHSPVVGESGRVGGA